MKRSAAALHVAGSWNMARHIAECASTALYRQFDRATGIIERAPGVSWKRLTKSQKGERLKEWVLDVLGIPKVNLDHGRRGTSLNEVIAICRTERIATFNEFRQKYWNLYKWARKSGHLRKLMTSMKWKGAYLAQLGGHATASQFEAIVANLLALAGERYRYDEHYPGIWSSRYRFDFGIYRQFGTEQFVEVNEFRLDSAKAKGGDHRAQPYVERRKEKVRASARDGVQVTQIEAEDFYGKKDWSLAFANYASRALRESGAISVVLSDADCRLAASSISIVSSDNCQCEKQLLDYLILIGVPDHAAAELVKLAKLYITANQGPVTRWAQDAGIDPWVCRYIYRHAHHFQVQRMRMGKCVTKLFSDSKHLHWAKAFVAALTYVNSTPFFGLPRVVNRGNKTRVWSVAS